MWLKVGFVAEGNLRGLSPWRPIPSCFAMNVNTGRRSQNLDDCLSPLWLTEEWSRVRIRDRSLWRAVFVISPISDFAFRARLRKDDREGPPSSKGREIGRSYQRAAHAP